MSTPMAMLRLFWRPETLTYVALVAVVALPLAGVEWLDLPRVVTEGRAPLPLRVALWHAAVLIPGTVGFALAEFRLEAQHLVLSWTVPGFRRGLLRWHAALSCHRNLKSSRAGGEPPASEARGHRAGGCQVGPSNH